MATVKIVRLILVHKVRNLSTCTYITVPFTLAFITRTTPVFILSLTNTRKKN